jgi:hypothetical protein
MVVAHRSRRYRQSPLVYSQVYNALSVVRISISIFVADDSSSWERGDVFKFSNLAAIWLIPHCSLGGMHLDFSYYGW